jgi:hypothetical protein
MRRAGLSLRLIADLVGPSHQRIQQSARTMSEERGQPCARV